MKVNINAVDDMNSLLWGSNSGASRGFAFSPFGSTVARRGDDSRLPAFKGERLDPLSPTYHLGNGYRTYKPSLMRFNGPDSWSPFGRGGLNQYAYCEGDPINRSDPSGHMSLGTIGGIFGAILGIVGAGLAIWTFGASVAAIGALETMSAMTAGLAAETLASGLAVAAVGTGIASVATAKSDPSLSHALGWASLAFGIASAVAGGIGKAYERLSMGSAMTDLLDGTRGCFPYKRGKAAIKAGDFPLEHEMPYGTALHYRYDWARDRDYIKGHYSYKSYINQKGAKIWLSQTETCMEEILEFGKRYLRGGEDCGRNFTILTGSHGSRKGLRTPRCIDRKMYRYMCKTWSLVETAYVENVAKLSHREILDILQGPEDVIVAFCYSRNDHAVREALGLDEAPYYVRNYPD